MPPISENANIFPAVPLIEIGDLVVGGSESSGPNRALKPLTDRTANNRLRIQSIIDNSTNLIVGSDVQAWDTDLDAVASLTGTGLIRRTGNGTAAVVTSWVDPSVAGGRLSLTAGVSFETADVVDANRIYYTPHTGGAIALRVGSEWQLVPFIESSVSIATLAANTNHDVFVYLNGASLAFELQAWTSDTARSVALVRQDGVWSKTGDLTRRYLGTVRTSDAGKTQNNKERRYLYNATNQLPHIFKKRPGANSWTAIGTNWRASNGDTSNRVQLVCGLAQSLVDLSAYGAAAINAQLGISVNSVGIPDRSFGGGQSHDSQTTTIGGLYKEYPRLGHSFYQLVELSQAGNSIFDGSLISLSGVWWC